MKKNTRVVLASLLAVITLISLVGCGGLQMQKKTTFERGKIEGNVYHSEFAALTFTKPESWVFNTDEEIAQLLGIGLDAMTDGEKFDASDLASTIDFQAQDPATGSNVNRTVEKLDAVNALITSIDQYVDFFRDTLKTQFDGFEPTFGDTTEVTIGGNAYKRITADVNVGGVSMTQVYLLRKIERYIVCVTCTAVNGTELSSLEAMLS